MTSDPVGLSEQLGGVSRDKYITARTTVLESGCWVWNLHLDRKGYGRATYRGVAGSLAHRIAYERLVGPVPEGMQLDHLCNNPRCVSPNHLEPVTNAENARRAAARRTHCQNGHEYTPANAYVRGATRYCRRCNAEAVRRYKSRKTT